MKQGMPDDQAQRLTVKRGLLAPLVLFASQTMVGVGLSVGANSIRDANVGEAVIDVQVIGVISALTGGVLALLWVWTDIRKFGPLFAQQLGLRPSVNGAKQTALTVIALLIATHLMAWTYRSVLLPLAGQGGIVGGGSQMFAHLSESGSAYGMALFMVLALIAGPVFEEVVYRGYLQSALTRRLPRWGAITITSLVFMAGHGPPVLWPMYFVFSAAWGWVFARTGSLKAAIAFHILNNLFYTVIAVTGWNILA
ncbi:MAG: membrane protease YdiL (CAAX protease family) [Chlamydiales bacterium]|jgi:membrane protease YdiL (CAAX protease family)